MNGICVHVERRELESRLKRNRRSVVLSDDHGSTSCTMNYQDAHIYIWILSNIRIEVSPKIKIFLRQWVNTFLLGMSNGID